MNIEAIAVVIALGFLGGLFVVLVGRSLLRNARWANSPDAREAADLEGRGLVATARLRAIEPWDCAPVTEVVRVRRGRSTLTQHHERVGAKLVVELLPLGATQPILCERTQTVRREDIPQLRPGLLFPVLHDPQNPLHFYLDSLDRQERTTAATMRTQQAEAQRAAAQRFGAWPPA